MIRDFMKFIKKIILLIIIIALLGGLGFALYMFYNDARSTDAKEYLLEKYGLESNEVIVKKFTEYVYEDITNCSTLWFKECSSDKDALYKFEMQLKDKTTFEVTQDVNKNFTDTYGGEVTEEWKQKEEQKKEQEENAQSSNSEEESQK